MTERFQIVLYWSGHSTQGGSTGKEWSGILARLDPDGAEISLPEEVEDDAPAWVYMAVYGKTGLNYQGGKVNPKPTTRKLAEAAFRATVKEKASATKGYQRTSGNVEVGEGPLGPLGFREFLPHFLVPLTMPDEQIGTRSSVVAAPAYALPSVKRSILPYAACDVKPITLEQLHQLMDDTSCGTGEKVDGRRRFVSFSERGLIGYNHGGVEVPVLPEAWRALERLGCPFVLDGEHLAVAGGLYAIFEPLAWGGEDVRGRPYQERHSTLEKAMIAAGLIKGSGPTLRQAVENSLVEGLALLSVSRSAQEAQEVFAQVQAQQGEGVVVRHLDGRYGGPRSIQKWKHTPTVDCIATSVERKGKVVGSVQLALVRESDGALIEVCHVRSGLKVPEVEEIARTIEEVRKSKDAPDGEKKHYPVLEVAFLLASTPGYKLVQPTVVSRRDDKHPSECSFGQFLELFAEGREKRAALIAAANPIENLTFS